MYITADKEFCQEMTIYIDQQKVY